MKCILWAALCGIALSGCIANRTVTVDTWSVTPAVAAMPTGGTAWRDWARRTNDQMRTALSPVTPMVELFFAERLAYAAEVDARRMTPERFDVAQKTKIAEYASIEQAERNATSDALIVAGAAIMSARPAPLPMDNSPPLLRRPVNCASQRFGATVQTNCF